MFTQHLFIKKTNGRGLINITEDIAQLVENTDITIGLCYLFLQHTSASLIFCENADPLVQQDLEAFIQRLIPDGDPLFLHVNEGDDDMPAHVRTVFTNNSLVIPIVKGKLGLGTWQGIYLWEHRLKSYHRKLVVTLHGK